MSLLGHIKTSYLLTLTKLKKLFFVIPLLETLLFCFICQELTELPVNKQRYLIVGVDVTDMLSTAAYVNRLLMQVNQHLNLLSLFQSSDIQHSSLHLLFNALVINKLTYALPTYAGQLPSDDIKQQ